MKLTMERVTNIPVYWLQTAALLSLFAVKVGGIRVKFGANMYFRKKNNEQ